MFIGHVFAGNQFQLADFESGFGCEYFVSVSCCSWQLNAAVIFLVAAVAAAGEALA